MADRRGGQRSPPLDARIVPRARRRADSARPLEAILSATIERLSLMPYVAAAKKREGRPATDAAEDARALGAATIGRIASSITALQKR